MKKWILIAVLVVTLLFVAGIWYYLLTKDKREVRNLVANVCELFCVKAAKLPHEGVLKHTKIEEYFISPVVLRCTEPDITANWTTDEFKGRFALYQRMVKEMKISTGYVEVDIADGKAVFSFDADISGSASLMKEEFNNVYRINGTAEKKDGVWKISSMIAEPIVKH